MRVRRAFTLIEVMVVIAVMMLALGIAGVRLRSGSPSVVFENRMRDFQRFLLRVRARSVELGRDLELTYDPAMRCFRAEAVKPVASGTSGLAADAEPINEWMAPDDLMLRSRSQEYTELAAAEEGGSLTPLEWTLPEELTLEDTADSPTVSLNFRFHADGGGVGSSRIRLTSGAYQAAFQISPVTGHLRRLREEELKE